MKKLLVSLAALVVLSLPATASADTLTFTPNPSDMGDLDHHNVYAWRIDNVKIPEGQKITGATLTIKNIANWDTNPNMLFIHLLDTAKVGGVSFFVDDPTNSSPVTDIRDDFVDTRYHSRSNWLLAPGTADLALVARSFTTTPQNFVFSFNAAQLATLTQFILNGGNFALGFDPDCHFFNDGITFRIETQNAPIPEPATMALLGTGLAGLYARRRRQQRARREV